MPPDLPTVSTIILTAEECLSASQITTDASGELRLNAIAGPRGANRDHLVIGLAQQIVTSCMRHGFDANELAGDVQRLVAASPTFLEQRTPAGLVLPPGVH